MSSSKLFLVGYYAFNELSKNIFSLFPVETNFAEYHLIDDMANNNDGGGLLELVNYNSS